MSTLQTQIAAAMTNANAADADTLRRIIVRTELYLIELKRRFGEITGGDRVTHADVLEAQRTFNGPARGALPPQAAALNPGVTDITLPPLTGTLDAELLDAAGGFVSQGEIDALLIGGDDAVDDAQRHPDDDSQDEEPERRDGMA